LSYANFDRIEWVRSDGAVGRLDEGANLLHGRRLEYIDVGASTEKLVQTGMILPVSGAAMFKNIPYVNRVHSDQINLYYDDAGLLSLRKHRDAPGYQPEIEVDHKLFSRSIASFARNPGGLTSLALSPDRSVAAGLSGNIGFGKGIGLMLRTGELRQWHCSTNWNAEVELRTDRTVKRGAVPDNGITVKRKAITRKDGRSLTYWVLEPRKVIGDAVVFHGGPEVSVHNGVRNIAVQSLLELGRRVYIPEYSGTGFVNFQTAARISKERTGANFLDAESLWRDQHLRRTGRNSVIVVGQSGGGAAAAAFAAHQPTKIMQQVYVGALLNPKLLASVGSPEDSYFQTRKLKSVLGVDISDEEALAAYERHRDFICGSQNATVMEIPNDAISEWPEEAKSRCGFRARFVSVSEVPVPHAIGMSISRFGLRRILGTDPAKDEAAMMTSSRYAIEAERNSD
jgi:pimeloyl-ACP methyl ester carboxylesterase